MHEEIKNELNIGNAYHHSAHGLSSFHLLPSNLETEIRNAINAFFVYGASARFWTMSFPLPAF